MIVVRAPVRLSFGGGGTDLATYYESHGGFVLSAAVTRYCYVVVREPVGRDIRINSADYGLWQTFGQGEIPPVQEPLSLPKAAIEWFADRGLQERGIDLFLASEVPPGTGLGSSSALTVALVQALAAYLGIDVDQAGLAEIACWLEIERLGMPIGKQDHYASAFGGINSLTFTSDGVGVDPLDLPRDVLSALAARLLLFSTGQSRHSSQILRQQRKDSGANPAVIASLHQLKGLAVEMRQALLAADLDSFGLLLHEGWQHKKRLSAKISSGAIDRWYEVACAAGALGGKITGAGGGGFLLLYAPPERRQSVRAALTRFGLREMTFDFDLDGARVLAGADEGALFTRGGWRAALENIIAQHELIRPWPEEPLPPSGMSSTSSTQRASAAWPSGLPSPIRTGGVSSPMGDPGRTEREEGNHA